MVSERAPQTSVVASRMTGDLTGSNPFADARAVAAYADRRTAQRLATVLRALGAPAAVSGPTLALVCADPLLRNIVAALATTLESTAALGPEDAETAAALARILSEHGGSGRAPEGLALTHRLRLDIPPGEPRAIGLWHPGPGADRLAAALAAQLEARVGGAQRFADFTAEQAAVLEAALALLSAAIPAVAAGMLGHVQLLCRLETPPDATSMILSSSFRDVSGVVFLADPVLTSPLQAAEHILHEACHQRYGELSHAASVLGEGYDDVLSSKILVPWHRPSVAPSLWSTDKALTAAHVYLHLAYFYGMLHDAPATAPAVDPAELRRRLFSTCERARYLLAALDAVGRPQLGYAGNLLLDWMIAMLDGLAIPSDSRARLTRLLLERYREEDREFGLHAGKVARKDHSADPDRLGAFTAWLDQLAPAAAQRFAKAVTAPPEVLAAAHDAPPPELLRPAYAPLARYRAARSERVRVVGALLGLVPTELAQRTDHRAVVAFAQAESVALDDFVDPRFRDRLVRRRALERVISSA